MCMYAIIPGLFFFQVLIAPLFIDLIWKQETSLLRAYGAILSATVNGLERLDLP